MIEIGRAIVSLDILEEQFLCNILKCKGACCVDGDSGAPVTLDEVESIKEAYPHFKSYLPEKHIEVIERVGFSVIDIDGDRVTPLVNNKQCAFTYFDKEVLKCGIEKAFIEGKISFRKPISCHLFPIRITEYKRFDAVNYQQIDICAPGRECGKANKLPLFVFLKDPLVRKYGTEWYEQLEYAANHYKK